MKLVRVCLIIAVISVLLLGMSGCDDIVDEWDYEELDKENAKIIVTGDVVIIDGDEDAVPTDTPTATPAPTGQPAATSTPEILVSLELLLAWVTAEPSIPLGTQMEYGQSFEQTWYVENSGFESWPQNTDLVWVSSENLAEVDRVPVGAVAPGDIVDITVPMTAPSEDGVWWSQWQLMTGDHAIEDGLLEMAVVTGEQQTVINGRVLWYNQPMAGITVKIGSDPNTPDITVTTDGDGRFVVGDPPRGDIGLWADPPDDSYSDAITWHTIYENLNHDVILYMPKRADTGMTFDDPTSSMPLITWEAFPDVTEYCLFLNTQQPVFDIIESGCTSEPQWQVSTELVSGQEYCWNVLGKAGAITIVNIAAPDESCFTVE